MYFIGESGRSRRYADCMISLGLSSSGTGRNSQPPVEVLDAIGETAAWCTYCSLRADGLRSSSLDPSPALNVPTLDELGINAFVTAKRDSYQRATESIKRKRFELLRDVATQPVVRLRLIHGDSGEFVSHFSECFFALAADHIGKIDCPCLGKLIERRGEAASIHHLQTNTTS